MSRAETTETIRAVTFFVFVVRLLISVLPPLVYEFPLVQKNSTLRPLQLESVINQTSVYDILHMVNNPFVCIALYLREFHGDS